MDISCNKFLFGGNVYDSQTNFNLTKFNKAEFRVARQKLVMFHKKFFHFHIHSLELNGWMWVCEWTKKSNLTITIEWMLLFSLSLSTKPNPQMSIPGWLLFTTSTKTSICLVLSPTMLPALCYNKDFKIIPEMYNCAWNSISQIFRS